MPRLKHPTRKNIRVKTASGKHNYSYIVNFQERILSDMHRYFRSVNWSDMWEDWYLSLNEDGGFKYKSIYQFAKNHGESQAQRSFLLWYLGPPVELKEEQRESRKYTFVDGPLDWLKKRQNGGWFTGDNVKKLSKELKHRFNVLDKMSAVGDTIGIGFLERAQAIASQLDIEFKGSLLNYPGRTKLYLQLQEEVLDYYAKAQKLYCESLGVNLEDMSGLVHLMTAAAQQAATRADVAGIQAPSREQAALKSFVEMTMTKAARYQLPMPADAEATIIDAIEEVDEAPRKKNLQ
jgi:hypothetical protein